MAESEWLRWYKVFGAELVSVIPYGAESNTIAKPLRGKVPGTRKKNGLWVGTIGSLADRHLTKQEAMAAERDGAAIGILAKLYPGIDIDTEDAVLASEVEAWALETLGPAPVRMREGSNRRLLMYKIGGGQPLRRREIEFEGGHKIEILGRGQYYNVHGIHPKGGAYYWRLPHHPCDMGPGNLRTIHA